MKHPATNQFIRFALLTTILSGLALAAHAKTTAQEIAIGDPLLPAGDTLADDTVADRDLLAHPGDLEPFPAQSSLDLTTSAPAAPADVPETVEVPGLIATNEGASDGAESGVSQWLVDHVTQHAGSSILNCAAMSGAKTYQWTKDTVAKTLSSDEVSAVPLPASIFLFGAGAALLVRRMRRARNT